MTVIEDYVAGMTFIDILELVEQIDGGLKDGACAALLNLETMATDFFLYRTPLVDRFLPADQAVAKGMALLALRQSPFAAFPLKVIVGPGRPRPHDILSNIATLRKVEAHLREQLSWSLFIRNSMPPEMQEELSD